MPHPATADDPTPASPRAARPRAAAAIFTAAALAAAAAASQPGEARAWGRLGHRASALLTESRLSPAAKAAVRDLLGPDGSLADASTWADEVRRDFPRSGPWHYVNVPITEEKYSGRFCGGNGCVVAKIGEFRKALADRSATRADRLQALRFLTHFVQDMHQPVHVGDRGDRGGNDTQVQFFGKGSNLHRVWDSGLLDRGYDGEADKELALLRDLLAASGPDKSGDDLAAAKWAAGTVEDWATESLTAARAAYIEPGTGRDLRSGSRLGDDYQAAQLPVARRRLAQSGVRLAAMLNAVFAEPE